MTTAIGNQRLPIAAKVRLVFEILGTYLRARRVLRHNDVRDALVAMRSGRSRHNKVDSSAVAQGIRLGRAVSRTLSLLPFDSRCLITSVVLTSLLSRRGIDNTVVIGVRPGDVFGAHAWVEVGGQPVIPRGSDFPRLVEL
jgi:hypothetical protein